jgi:hypothetical protein
MSGDLHLRIPPELFTKLKIFSQDKGVAQKWVVVTALEEFFGGGKEAEITELCKEVYELKRRVSALRGDVEILGELLSFYIYHWLGYTPRLEKSERASLAVEAKERHQKFMDMFAKKLRVGDMGLSEVYANLGRLPDEGTPDKNDLEK